MVCSLLPDSPPTQVAGDEELIQTVTVPVGIWVERGP
jgi:hypothetical protein